MPKPPKKPKRQYNGEVEHRLLRYLSERIGGPLDGWFRNNYLACEELIRRCEEHGSDPEATIRQLIDIATDPKNWHSRNASSFTYLLNHGRAIWKSAVAAHGAGSGDKERGILEAVARQQGITIADNG